MIKPHHYRTAKLLALLAGLTVTGLASTAQACIYYGNTSEATRIWGLPEENTSAVQAIIPARASVCVEERLLGQDGANWGRVGFYLADQVRYNVRGWMPTSRLVRTDNRKPRRDAVSPPKSKTDRFQSRTELRETLRLKEEELGRLRAENEKLKQRLAALNPGAEQKTDRPQPTPIEPMQLFSQNWRLNTNKSKLSVQSVMDDTFIETHQFTKLNGEISRTGQARVDIALNSIRTGIKIRDVRLSHLLFDSDKFPTATIRASLDKQRFAALAKEGKLRHRLKVKLKLHDHEKELEARVKIERMDNGSIAVSSLEPVMVSAGDFALNKGIRKLIEAAGGKSIIPVVPVRFNLVFDADT